MVQETRALWNGVAELKDPPVQRDESPAGCIIRPLEARDLGGAMELKELAGWNQTRRDWESFLAFRPHGCFAAEVGGRLVGTATTIDHGGACGWIGMVLVHPDHRGRGIGTRLLRTAIESLGGCETVKLDATPLGRRVYLPLGFADELELERRVRPAASLATLDASMERTIRPVRPSALDQVAAFDAAAFGAPRPQVLRAWLERAPPYAFICQEAAGTIRGYCLGRDGSRAEQLGPLVAESVVVARALLAHVLVAARGRSLLVDVPRLDHEWLALLDQLGFAVERGFVRMVRGSNRSPGVPGKQWAIAGPEVG